MSIQKWLVSGYTAPNAPDLLLIAVDSETGCADVLASKRLGDNPSYLTKGEGRIFAAFEVHDPLVSAKVAALKVTADGPEIDRAIEIPGAYGLCQLSADGDSVYGACWASGHVFCVDAELSAVRWCVRNGDDSGKTPHAHWTAMGPDKLLYCADVGLDRLLAYDPKDGLLVRSAAMPEGSAPRQILFAADGQSMFVINESVPTFHVLDRETLTIRQTFSLPADNYPGAACLTPSGLLLVPARGPDLISLFQTDGSAVRQLGEFLCGGSFPRLLACDAAGRMVLCMNQRGDNFHVFRLDGDTLLDCGGTALPGASCAIQIL